MERSVRVCLSELSLEALGGEDWKDPEHLPARLVRAFRLYLKDRDSKRSGWAYPAFLRKRESGGVELELRVDDELLGALEAEAAEQEISISRMAEHAALYYAAELDAGHLTQRIVGDLDAEG